MGEEQTNGKEENRLESWQKKLLPFMIGSILFMGLFFFVVSLVQLYYFYGEVRHTDFSLKPVLEEFEAKHKTEHDNLGYLRWKTMILLEQNVIKRRYHQVNSAMLARVWTRYMGFVTGMILALVGAAFILGKLREPPTNLSADTKVIKASVYSSSPGIILAVLGTILMVLTLAIPFEIKTRDIPTYTRSMLPEPKEWKDASSDFVKQRENELFSTDPGNEPGKEGGNE